MNKSKTVFAAAAAVAVAWSAQAGRSIEAFENAGFEDVSKFHGEKNGVEIAGGLGYSTSGGLRLFPCRAKNGKIRYDFKTDFKPVAGKRYKFGFSYRPHGKVFAHCFWESYGNGTHLQGCWNVTEEELTEGWKRKWVTFVPKSNDSDRNVFATIALAADAASRVCTGMDEYVEFDDVFLEEDEPAWLFTNVWPTHNYVFSDNPRVRFYSAYSGEVLPKGGKPVFNIELLSESGKVLSKREVRGVDGSFTVSFANRIGYKGRGKLRASVSDSKTGKVCARNEIDVKVLPTVKPGPGGTFVTENGIALLDGKPFMPLGFFASFGHSRDIGKFETAMAEWKAASANLLLEYWFFNWGEKYFPRVFRILEDNGIKLMLNVTGWHHRKDLLYTEHRDIIGKFMREPSLFAYYLTDEAPMTLIPYVYSMRRMINETDPDRPTWECNLFDPAAYLKISDCYGADYYPIAPGSKGLERMDADMRKWAVCRPSVAWLCPQCFNKANYRPRARENKEIYDTNGVEPTEEGMLAVALLQASWGARGFIFYMWDDLFRGPYPERYEVRKRAMLRNIRKLRELEPFIMSGEAIEELRHKDVKGRTRAVKMSDGKGAWRVIVIGLGMDNEASFALPDGSKHTFRGGEFSCEIL
ncbi:MAG: hypothetical protein IKC80_06135 [Kiritimatiellae bacterium]|nr:hypothetical protein [Kiritimatiellia bacterium]